MKATKLQIALERLDGLVGRERAIGMLADEIMEQADGIARQIFRRLTETDPVINDWHESLGIRLEVFLERGMVEEAEWQDELNESGRREEESRGVI